MHSLTSSVIAPWVKPSHFEAVPRSTNSFSRLRTGTRRTSTSFRSNPARSAASSTACERVDGWLGEPRRDHAEGTITLLYRLNSEIPPTRPLRLKVEINTREHFAVFGHVIKPFAVQSRWFEARARIRTYSVDELLATKLRALYQRRRGRDLFDLWDALTRAAVDPERVIEAFRAYLERGGARISRAEFERNFARKAHDRAFLDEGRALLAADVEYDPREAVELIRRKLIQRLPGEPWKGR